MKNEWILGINYKKRILLDKIQGKVNLIQEVIISPLGDIPLHKHKSTDEIFYIISGSPIIKIEDRKKELYPGDIITVEKEINHGFINESKNEVKLICLKINYRDGDSYLG